VPQPKTQTHISPRKLFIVASGKITTVNLVSVLLWSHHTMNLVVIIRTKGIFPTSKDQKKLYIIYKNYICNQTQ